MRSGRFEDEVDETRGFDDAAAADDPRLLEAVKEYVAAVDSGRKPNRQEFISRHPEISTELSACLQGLAFVNSAMGEVNARAGDAVGEDEAIAGQPLGDFRLLREIGRGGMGVVYEAQQLSLGRRVAVKVLPMAAALDPRHLQRFRNEAQAAAQLHHSNIVPVYAVGCERSVHYYAMQLIDGQSIEKVIATLRICCAPAGAAIDSRTLSQTVPTPSDQRLSAMSANAPLGPAASARPPIAASVWSSRTSGGEEAAADLPALHTTRRASYFRIVARLAVQAAEALAYAHQQGIVHRDIKPGNLLLDAHGALWITDFGLAQMYSGSDLTQTGDVLGTFRYMSPEQASGRAVVLDQRTDIYSLGVTLYELLTLERALPGRTREELMHQISFFEPRSPRAIDRKIPPELQNIIGRAMAKDAADRYPTAQALADDLQRFLDDKPVLARRPSLFNRAIKWARRHRAVTLSAGMVLVLTTIGSGVSSVLIAREQSRTRTAYLQEQARAIEANQQKQRAVKSFDQAREAVDFLSSMAVTEMPADPQFLQVRWQMLETSLAYYQSFLDQQKDDPSLSAQLAAAEAKVSSVLAGLAAVDEFVQRNFEIRLLNERPVQEDLGLSQAQAQAARALAAALGSRPPGAGPDAASSMTSEQIRSSVSQDAAVRQAALTTILSPAQSKRLREISRQARGAFAFSDADVTAALALTAAQKNLIRSACAEFHNHHHPGPHPPAQQSERTEMASIVARIDSVLAPHQRDIWKGLVGLPYGGPIPAYQSWFGPGRADHHEGRDGPHHRGEDPSGQRPDDHDGPPGDPPGPDMDRDPPPPPPPNGSH